MSNVGNQRKSDFVIFALTAFIFCFVSPCAFSQNHSASESGIHIKLWGSKSLQEGKSHEEEILPSRGDDVIRITNIVNPSIVIYKPKDVINPTPAVLVCPGGRYKHVAFNKCGTEIAQWLNSLGITAIVLKYRVPDKASLAFHDSQRALSMIRYRAKDWNIDPNNIGMIGFSAGAHLTAMLSTNFQKRNYEPIDKIDKVSCRPDFAMLVYPGGLIRSNSDLKDEFTVTPDTPRAFLIHAHDDPVPVENSISYYLALKKANVPSELHIFPSGGHGYGMRPSEHAVSKWPKLCEVWLKKSGVIKDNSNKK